jgi:hypothetical protein
LGHFSPERIKLNPAKDKNWRKEVENILKRALKEKGGNEIDRFSLNSYYGPGKPTDPYFISLTSPSTREFAAGMGRGDYGSLD